MTSTGERASGPEAHNHRQAGEQVDGKLSIPRGTYLRVFAPRHGRTRQRPSAAAITFTKGGMANHSTAAVHVAAVAGQPAGFGQQIAWTGQDDLAIVAFINSADDYGLCVSGVNDGDTFELVSADGKASFSTDTRNNGTAGLLSAICTGAGITATAFGIPEVSQLIAAASAYARQQFPESDVPAKRRNAYGEDDNGGKARQEGGVIVCEPLARGVYGSGSSDHQDRWIQADGTRVDSNRPRHIPENHAFFLRREMGQRRLHGSGDLFLSAWDFSFSDNAGSYQVRLILRRGDGCCHPGLVAGV